MSAEHTERDVILSVRHVDITFSTGRKKKLTAVKDANFDIYRGEQIGEGRKSMAFKITFEADDKPLQPEELDKYIKKILGNLKFKLGAEIR